MILDRLDNRAFDVSAFFFDDRPQRAWQSFAKRFWQEHLASLLGIDVAERLHGLVPVRGVLAGLGLALLVLVCGKSIEHAMARWLGRRDEG